MVEKQTIFLTLSQRRKIIEIFKTNEAAGVKVNVAELAKRFKVSVTTIQRLRIRSRNNETVPGEPSDESSYLLHRKRLTPSKNPLLEDILYAWYKEKKISGQPVTTAILRENALIINKEINGDPAFKASNGWFYKFKDRLQIRSFSMQGETLAGDLENSVEFADALASVMRNENLQLHQVYNADETGLFWRMMPSVNFINEFEKNPAGYKVSNDRVTVMVCANADGSHKIPLFVIGKSKFPRCFRNVNQLPVIYDGQKNAWMSRELYKQWITTVFLPSVREFQANNGNNPQKVLLIVDNARCHLSKEETESIDDMIIVLNHPPNVTSLIQPMDQGVIENMKQHYRTSLLRELLLEKDEPSLIEFLKRRDMKQCCIQLASAWSEVTPVDIRRAWRKLIPGCDVDVDNFEKVTEDDILKIIYRLPGFQNTTQEQVSTWLQADRLEPGWNVLNLEQIIQRCLGRETIEVICDKTDEQSEDDMENDNNIKEEEATTANIIIDATAAYNGFTVFRKWFEQRWECDSNSMIHLQKFNEITKDVLATLNDLNSSEDS